MLNTPDIAIINFSSVNDRTVQRAVRAVNRQVNEDFSPIWGSAYACKIHAPAYDVAQPDQLAEDPVPAEAVIYLVDSAHLEGALGYHSINSAEVPIGFVFTDLGDWTVTLSHEVLELIVDPTVNIFVPGTDPRDPDNEQAWLWHAYEVCDAVERTVYEIDDVWVSNFVTPCYFSLGNSPGTRNDFLGIGVDSFGLLPGCHLGTMDPLTYQWTNILGSEFPSRQTITRRLKAFSQGNERSRATDEQEATLQSCIRKMRDIDPDRGEKLSRLTALRRSTRKEAFFNHLKPGPYEQSPRASGSRH